MRIGEQVTRTIAAAAALIALLSLAWLLGACRSAPAAPAGTAPDASGDVSETAPAPTGEATGEATGWATRAPETILFDDGVSEEPATEREEATAARRAYRQSFDEPIPRDDPDFFANAVSDFSGGTLTSTRSRHCYLSCKHRVTGEKALISLSLRADRPHAAPHDSGYVGLRVSNYDNEFNAVGNTGVWLAFQNDTAGLISTWPNVPLFRVPHSFGTASRILIEDDRESNVISVFAAEETGRRLLFRVVIEEGRRVSFVDADGRTRHSAVFPYDVDDEGYVCFWAHQNNGGVVYDDVSIEWEETGDAPYQPGRKSDMRDLRSDTWTATDGLGRAVGAGPCVRDKLVGIFYEVWNTQTHVVYPDQLLYDHNALYREGGVEAVRKAVDSGPLGWGHFWAEPYFGYYLATDRYVIRKHASMLSDIGVDFLFLDVTNGNPFTTVYKTLFREFRAMRDEGQRTPDICFLLSDRAEVNGKVFDDLWQNLYASGRYRDLYCLYRGKPLILGNLSAVDPERASAFTVRRCWALRENLGSGRDVWSWMCETPQVASRDSKTGEIEEISVSAGILANLSIGRSWTAAHGQPPLGRLPDGSLDEFQFNLASTPRGLLFAEQMARAQRADPYVVLLTGWNEWTAGRWETDKPGVFIANTQQDTRSYYVDAFNPEFSRDIEPMRGGFGDNYYYQLAAFLREFKGTRPIPAAVGQREIAVSDPPELFEDVGPEYRDARGDTFHRDSLGFGGFHRYVNESGRNDIVSAKVSVGPETACFLVTCADDITPPEGRDWMNLLIDSDRRSDTGFEGFDLIIGRDASGAAGGTGTVSIERLAGNRLEGERIGEARVRLVGRSLLLSVPRGLCGLGGDFDFKWADHACGGRPGAMDFLDLGDAAPNGRFRFAYRTSAPSGGLNPDLRALTEGGAGFRVGSPYMAAGGRVVPLDDGSDAARAESRRGRICAPVLSLGRIPGATAVPSADGRSVAFSLGGRSAVFTEGETNVAVGADVVVIPLAPYISRGRLYVPLNAFAFLFQLEFLSDPSAGVALVAPADAARAVTDPAAVLRILDRSV